MSGVRSSWLIRLTNWSFMRLGGPGLGHVGADEVPAGVHAAVVGAGGDRDRDRALVAVGGDVGPVPDVAAVLLGGVHEGGEPGRGPGVLGGELELLGQVELHDRPLADDLGARQAEHLLRARVPDADDAVPVGADDRLLGDRVDDAGHRLGAGRQHAGGEVELVGAGLHLGEQGGALALQAVISAAWAASRRVVSLTARPPRPTTNGPSSRAPGSASVAAVPEVRAAGTQQRGGRSGGGEEDPAPSGAGDQRQQRPEEQEQDRRGAGAGRQQADGGQVRERDQQRAVGAGGGAADQPGHQRREERGHQAREDQLAVDDGQRRRSRAGPPPRRTSPWTAGPARGPTPDVRRGAAATRGRAAPDGAGRRCPPRRRSCGLPRGERA